MTTSPRRRVLFVAEAVTLAHVARPLTLGRALDPSRYEVHLAVDGRYDRLIGETGFARHPLASIPSARFLETLSRGQPLYDADTLRAYVREDRELIERVAPDVVVGDFRLSLSVSARLAKVPYLTITNAYWSPFAPSRFPLPDLPMARKLPLPLARAVFRAARPIAFALHTRALNGVRREHGLPSLGPDLRRVYTDADRTLYADVPELFPIDGLPPEHQYLGTIPWSPALALPSWWDDLPGDRPVVAVNLGSSGPPALLPGVLAALAELPVTVMAATLGRPVPGPIAENVRTADFLPGDLAASRATVVVCNGGSPATQQALAAGKPVLGLASNMDQHMNMDAIVRWGAGELLRSERATPASIRGAVERLLGRPSHAEAAAKLARIFALYDAGVRFQGIVDGLFTAA